MTVAELKSMLENASVDNFGQVVFKDQTGTPCGIKVTDFGPVSHINPAQPTDPSYLEIQLVTS